MRDKNFLMWIKILLLVLFTIGLTLFLAKAYRESYIAKKLIGVWSVAYSRSNGNRKEGNFGLVYGSLGREHGINITFNKDKTFKEGPIVELVDKTEDYAGHYCVNSNIDSDHIILNYGNGKLKCFDYLGDQIRGRPDLGDGDNNFAATEGTYDYSDYYVKSK